MLYRVQILSVAAFRATNSGCSRAKSRRAGFCRLTPLLPLPDRNGRKLVDEWRAGKMRGAPFGLRPCRVRKRLAIKVTFNQNGTTHGSFPTSLIFRKILFPREFYLCRGAIRRERPAFQPAFRPSTNLNHFYPVAEMRQGNKLPPYKSRSTGFGSQQPEFAARQTATSESAQ